ncbi:hypothetical protein O7632_23970 [Solwaraspora sp. WMMD406]|uniref:hypothetical protein n=1 Tax=Solwaraspora sp. WMMD406 TaxID=3016095 RepID=UPI0024173331|nr:hypothetical protein [Solwaraspora sp. WMMD406]MDG4767131.1 hypothetical protein [Solwaraspora sp. WMMD406]
MFSSNHHRSATGPPAAGTPDSAMHAAPTTAPGWTRRGLGRLAAGALFAVAVPAGLSACDLFGADPEPTPEPDPLAGLLADTIALADQYDAAIAAFPELSATVLTVAATHRAHARELARVTDIPLPDPSGSATAAAPGPSTTTQAAPSPPVDLAATRSALRTSEEQAGTAAAAACRTAPADRAAMLGSITAARACHLELLR